MLWPVETLIALYERRCRVELYFDDIKTTMHASAMRCLSPAMVRCELLLVHAIAYKLIRRIMLQSAWQQGTPMDQLSFKGTLNTARHLAAHHRRPAQHRRTRRGPKTIPTLTRHRRQMRVSHSRNNNGKARKSTKVLSLN